MFRCPMCQMDIPDEKAEDHKKMHQEGAKSEQQGDDHSHDHKEDQHTH